MRHTRKFAYPPRRFLRLFTFEEAGYTGFGLDLALSAAGRRMATEAAANPAGTGGKF